jgi:hypothetical protein
VSGALRKEPPVADVLFVVITVAFFVLCVGYVKVCDRIIGPDPAAPSEAAEETEREKVPA